MPSISIISALLLSLSAYAQVLPPSPPNLTPLRVAPSDSEMAEEILVGRSELGRGTAILITTEGGPKKLASVPGTLGRTWAYFVTLMWADFPEMRSELHVSDPRPSFFVAMDQTPKNRIFLVKCRVNHRTRNRSVKMGQAGVFTYHGISAPDADWTLPFDTLEVKSGLWKLTPKEPLLPGEYGFFSGAASAYATKGNPAGELFEFSVDTRS